MAGRRPPRRLTARAVALQALGRIEQGAYANLVLPGLLERSGLDQRDRAFATDLVYGTTRLRRALDFSVGRFLYGDVEPAVRDALRLGAYQLSHLRLPPHAAVGETVEEVRGKARGLVNAVLRRVAENPDVEWPDDATRLSYPDWVVRRLVEDLGEDGALAALERMNEAPTVTERPDGYVQDPASQLVAAYVGADKGERVADLCSAPGGKATFLTGRGAFVAAGDVNVARAGLVATNARRLELPDVAPYAADARRSPFRPACFDRVLLDAPCSGLGVLRRRPDARWRIEEGDVGRLAALQRELLEASIGLLRPGGTLVYSVCTLTAAESTEVDEWLAAAHPELVALEPPEAPWQPIGRGARLLPQTADTDGMYVIGLRTPPK